MDEPRGHGEERWRPPAWDEGHPAFRRAPLPSPQRVPKASAPAPAGSATNERHDEEAEEEQAEWGEEARSEPRWPASLAVLVAIVLYVALPSRVQNGLGPRWLVPALEGALGLALLVADPRIARRSLRLRVAAIALIAIINVVNLVSLAELVHALLYEGKVGGRALVFSAVPLWLTNIIVFALWYWELDRGGPAARLRARRRQPDFLFPQMATPHSTTVDWTPTFLDYLYTSFTNATAFSPTDTMPLTAWAKILMLVQSLTSLLIVVIVISRAVNILS